MQAFNSREDPTPCTWGLKKSALLHKENWKRRTFLGNSNTQVIPDVGVWYITENLKTVVFCSYVLCMVRLNWNAKLRFPQLLSWTKIWQCLFSVWASLVPTIYSNLNVQTFSSCIWLGDRCLVAGWTHNEVEQNVSWASNRSTKRNRHGDCWWCAATRASLQRAVRHRDTTHRPNTYKSFEMEGPIKWFGPS